MGEHDDGRMLAILDTWLEHREPAMIDRLRDLVNTNSGLDNPDGRLACLVAVERVWKMLGFKTERIERPGQMVHMVARRPARVTTDQAAPRVLLLGHVDTVFDRDTAFLSFSRVGSWASGPGVGDMKGGIIVAQTAMQALAHVGRLDEFDIVVVHNADEEVQSPTSRDLIEELAADRDLCLDFEVGRASGAVVRSRAGVGRYFITARGRAAHSGMHHADGANAIVTLAHLVGKLAELTDYERGTTVNVGVFRGGTRRNVVPDEARCAVDLRVRDAAEGERVDKAIRALCEESAVPGVSLEIDGGVGRPPWRRSAGSERLVAHFQAVADDLEIPLGAEDTGGGSDANFVAALGIPCVDGLGPVGEGVHTERERIRIETLRQRAKLVAIALLRWRRPVEAEA